MRRQNENIEAIAQVRSARREPAHPSLFYHTADCVEDCDVSTGRDDIAVDIPLPLTAYRGVAIRIIPGLTEEEDRVAVVLSHGDPLCTLSLFEAADDRDVIAEWRRWGAVLNLPLLMEGIDGHLVAAETRLGDVEVRRPRPRRRHSLLSGRRPRFLTRRRTGKLPLVPFVHLGEREIIAAE